MAKASAHNALLAMALSMAAACTDYDGDAYRAGKGMVLLRGQPLSAATDMFGPPNGHRTVPKGDLYIWSNAAKYTPLTTEREMQENGIPAPALPNGKYCLLRVLAKNNVILAIGTRGNPHTCSEYNQKLDDYMDAHTGGQHLINKQYLRKTEAPGDDTPVPNIGR